MNTSNLQKNVIATARVVMGSTLWMDHFTAVSIIAKQIDNKLAVVDISASQWEKATTNLSLDERLEILSTITGKKVMGYEIPVSRGYKEDADSRFGGVSHGVMH